MKGSKLLACITAALAVACFTGFLQGAHHQLFFAIGAAILAKVLYKFKPAPCTRL